MGTLQRQRQERLRRDRARLEEACQRGILFLRGKGWTCKRIGLYIGYEDANTAASRIGSICNEGGLPRADKLLRLSRLMSREGCDALAELFGEAPKAKDYLPPDLMRAVRRAFIAPFSHADGKAA